MNKNLSWKLIVIVATLLLFAYGIFGVPNGASGSALLSSLQNRIHLGLDLKGGTHLILHCATLCRTGCPSTTQLLLRAIPGASA